MQQSPTSRLRRRKGSQRHGVPYLQFGTKSIFCLAIFSVIYLVFMMCFLPMLKNENEDLTSPNTAASNSRESLRNAMKGVKRPHMITHKDISKAKEKIVKKEKEIVGKVKEETSALKEGLDRFRNRGELEKELMLSAWEEFKNIQQTEEKSVVVDVKKTTTKSSHKKASQGGDDIPLDEQKPVGGFMVLGMHRSGTSMLAGLLVEGFGYFVGSPLIQPSYDNEKGFFELITAVLQNDAFMYKQNVDWSANVINFDAKKALKDYHQKKVDTTEGKRALSQLNNPDSVPWLQKDPRMCITMRTWLPLLDTRPAVIFTYRQPLEVAMSLKNRQKFKLDRGLRLWIVYNMKAIQNSFDLCRVLSSNNAVLKNPMRETKRIVQELTKCGVPQPPKEITQKIVDYYVDPKLQHNKNALKKNAADKKVLEKHGDCVVKDYDSDYKDGSEEQKREKDLYLKAMKMYCDFESGKAYENDYIWPRLL